MLASESFWLLGALIIVIILICCHCIQILCMKYEEMQISHMVLQLHTFIESKLSEVFCSFLVPISTHPTMDPPWALGVMCRSQAKLIFPPQVAQIIVVSDQPSLWYHWTPSQYLCHASKQYVRKVKKFRSFTRFYNSKHFSVSKFLKNFAVFLPTYIHHNLFAAGTWAGSVCCPCQTQTVMEETIFQHSHPHECFNPSPWKLKTM